MRSPWVDNAGQAGESLVMPMRLVRNDLPYRIPAEVDAVDHTAPIPSRLGLLERLVSLTVRPVR